MYATNHVPRQDVKNAPTGCCPKFEPKNWDGKTFHFEEKLFMKVNTRSFLYMPLNMGKVLSKGMADIEAAKASSGDEYIIMSSDPSPWRGEHLISVSKEVPGADMVQLSGDFAAKTFEGPYGKVSKWYKQMISHAKTQGKKAGKVYFFYTTCPKCAKVYGKNYVVGLVELL